jgi:hypothetical protein
MDERLIVAVRSIEEALDAGDGRAVGDLRFVLMTLSSYAQRREFGRNVRRGENQPMQKKRETLPSDGSFACPVSAGGEGPGEIVSADW